MKMGPIIMCIFIFIIFAILLSFAVICIVEAIEKVAQKIRLRRKYKTAREMLENWPEGCPKPTNDEIRKYFGFPLEKEKNDRN